MNQIETFNAIYANARAIEYNPRWNNGTGYYDGAVDYEDAPVLAVGEVVRSISPMPNNRKLLLVGTPVGNVVVFQRYTNRDDIFAYCASTAFNRIAGSQHGLPLSAEYIERIFNQTENIGQWIKNSTNDDIVHHIQKYKATMARSAVDPV